MSNTNQRGARTKESFSTIMYLTASKGKFVQRVKEDGPDVVSRILEKGPNKGSIAYERFYADFTGRLINIQKEENNEYGPSWTLTFDTSTEDQESKIILKLPFKSAYADDVLFRLPNLDLKKDCILYAWSLYDKESKKERSGISIQQEGNKIQRFFTKEKPNGLPPLEQITVNGKKVWDSTKKLQFLENRMVPKYVKDLQELYGSNAKVQEAESEQEESDELPF